MYFDGDIKEIGSIDIYDLAESMRLIPEETWQKDWRKKVNPNFTQSHSIWPVSLPFTNDNVFHVFDSLVTCDNEDFGRVYRNFSDQLETQLNGKILRSCIIRLAPGNGVSRHIDGTHPVFRHCLRLIIPVITNDKAVLRYDNGEYVLKSGIIYDTNPYLPHSTYNGGDSYRYQAVVDLLPNDTDCDLDLMFYSWDLDLYKELEKKVPVVNRNRHLKLKDEILNTEKSIVKNI
jgi:hypothetical protein